MNGFNADPDDRGRMVRSSSPAPRLTAARHAAVGVSSTTTAAADTCDAASALSASSVADAARPWAAESTVVATVRPG